MKSVNIDLASAIAINFNNLATVLDQYSNSDAMKYLATRMSLYGDAAFAYYAK